MLGLSITEWTLVMSPPMQLSTQPKNVTRPLELSPVYNAQVYNASILVDDCRKKAGRHFSHVTRRTLSITPSFKRSFGGWS
ncbi:hypothetical protein SeMB42_g02325 [Synchytrium endobioticum]|uniref:Uncharacterized protein n=1 Tax=Synchytrium endobioticum TaxID=286115 RepID=A0A507DEW6_9FUNG|nr:hypothetical protein SeLEV6574_g03117 [Synchytrium endobioticum]TPX50232.1 hypothetical protein SeMB42_g02325 [Synchytrium endobioticum]